MTVWNWLLTIIALAALLYWWWRQEMKRIDAKDKERSTLTEHTHTIATLVHLTPRDLIGYLCWQIRAFSILSPEETGNPTFIRRTKNPTYSKTPPNAISRN